MTQASEEPELATVLADIAARNAGRPTLTIWKDGDYVVHGALDAEIETRCEPDLILLNLDIATMKYVNFRTREELQDSIRMHEKLLFTPLNRKGQ